jgi:hypothetical protein
MSPQRPRPESCDIRDLLGDRHRLGGHYRDRSVSPKSRCSRSQRRHQRRTRTSRQQ